MNEQWSFRYQVALPLEYYGKKTFGNTSISADEICNGGFADAMIQIISVLYSDKDDYVELSSICEFLDRKTATEIDRESATRAFDEFKRLADIRLLQGET
ncbi:MAG: hypothetical protein IKS18_06845 [Lachnospiraceae bacterium]|nr:hypothetical protein [Lachnospiraceae bacterium]